MKCKAEQARDDALAKSEEKELSSLKARYDALLTTNRKLSSELIEVKLEKSHNEQLLDAMQNVFADFGFKMVDINE